MWGVMWGFIAAGRRAGDRRPARRARTGWVIWPGEGEAGVGHAGVRLEQMQLCGPCDGCPAIGDVKLAVDVLGMGADRAQGNHELTGNLRSRKLGSKQAEHGKLPLAERLAEGLRNEGRGARRGAGAPLVRRVTGGQQRAGIGGHDPARGGRAEQVRHGGPSSTNRRT